MGKVVVYKVYCDDCKKLICTMIGFEPTIEEIERAGGNVTYNCNKIVYRCHSCYDKFLKEKKLNLICYKNKE